MHVYTYTMQSYLIILIILFLISYLNLNYISLFYFGRNILSRSNNRIIFMKMLRTLI
jgi:hypothetical protein